MPDSGFLARRRGLTVPPATHLLDDRDHAEDDDEGQDAVELDIAAQDREDAIPRRAGWCGGGIVAEAVGIDAGIRIAARRVQRRQRPPTAPVVVLDLFERAWRETHRQMKDRPDGDRAVARLRHAVDAIDVAANVDAGGLRQRAGQRHDRALHALRPWWRFEGA